MKRFFRSDNSIFFIEVLRILSRLRLFVCVVSSAFIFFAAPVYAVDLRFEVTADDGALVGYTGITMVGYATGPGQGAYFEFPEPIALLPGQTIVTPVIPGTMMVDQNGYVIPDNWHARLIFRLAGSPIYMTPDSTDVRVRLTITTAPPVPVGELVLARVSDIEVRREQEGGLRPTLAIAAPRSVDFNSNTPLTMPLSITAAVAPMTSVTVPAFIILGSG